MKKIIALLLSMIMAVSCASAFAENSFPEAEAYKISSTAHINGDVLNNLINVMGESEIDSSLTNSIVSLVNMLSGDLIVQDDGAILSLKAGDTEVMNLRMLLDDARLLLDSTLFPSYVLDMTEAMNELVKEMEAKAASAEQEDNTLSPAMEEFATGLMEDLIAFSDSALSEAVSKDVILNDVAYTDMMQMELKMSDVAVLFTNIYNRMASNEEMKAVLAAVTPEQLAEFEEAMSAAAAAKGTEEDVIVANCNIYSDADGKNAAFEAVNADDANDYMLLQIKNTDTEIGLYMRLLSADVAPENNDFSSLPEANIESSFEMDIKANEQSADIKIAVNADGLPIALNAKITAGEAENSMTAVCDIYIVDMSAALLSTACTAGPVAAEAFAISEEKTLLNAGTMDETAAQQLMLDVSSNGLSALMQQLYAAAPEEMNVLVTALTPQPTAEPSAEPSAAN